MKSSNFYHVEPKFSVSSRGSYCKSHRLGIVIIINKNYRNSIVGGEQKQKKKCLGRRTWTTTSSATSATAHASPPPPSSATTAASGLRAIPSPRSRDLWFFSLFLIWNDWSGSISLKSDLIPFFSILSGCVVEFFFPPLYVNASLWWVVGWSLITPISSCFVIIVGVGNLGFWIWGLVDSHESYWYGRMLCCV